MKTKREVAGQILTAPNWEAVWDRKGEIQDELLSLATKMVGRRRRFARLLASWFTSERDKMAVLERPDVLEIFWLLMLADRKGLINKQEISQSLQLSLNSADYQRANGIRIRQMLMYPVLILIAFFVLVVGFGVFVMPEYEKLFADFGISLPMTTVVVFRMAGLLREYSLWLITLPILIAVSLWAVGFVRRAHRPVGLGWLEKQFRKSRSAYADWAWHVALLLQVGERQDDAIRIASNVTHEARIDLSGQHGDAYASKRRFRLLEWALRQDNDDLKVAMLVQVSNYYRDQSQRVGEWWLQWLITFMFWVIGGAVLFVMVALLAPLYAIIRGLGF